MAYIKWKRNKPFVYKSERITTFRTVEFETEEISKVKSVYLGSYRNYREKRPNGTFDQLIKSESRLKLMSTHPERLNMLHSIDEEVYEEFEKGRVKK